MENITHFDLIVIGTGAAASMIAYKYNVAGRNVAVIDLKCVSIVFSRSKSNNRG